jgi:hypothetical protein
VRVTFDTDNHFRFVFYSEWHGDERVRCVYPNRKEETVTLDQFIKTMKAEQRRRKKLVRP